MSDRVTDDRRFADLMRAAQEGDSDAYAQLLRALLPRLRRMVRARWFLRPEDTEDLVQDVLLSVHQVRATYDPRRPFTPWLVAIVRHRLADHARRYRRGATREVAVEDLDVTFSRDKTNVTIGGYGDPEALHRAIRSLPQAQRAAIGMLKLGGMSLAEAAKASGSSVAALKVATHRAMQTLRRKLAKSRS
jgi:RNA polymerase sigma-70 factor (ECF subfamily)